MFMNISIHVYTTPEYIMCMYICIYIYIYMYM